VNRNFGPIPDRSFDSVENDELYMLEILLTKAGTNGAVFTS